MTDRYLIVADDFTGGNDTGVQLRRRGHATGMIFAGGRIPSAGSVVIDTESRGMTGAEAGEAVSRALADVDLKKWTPPSGETWRRRFGRRTGPAAASW